MPHRQVQIIWVLAIVGCALLFVLLVANPLDGNQGPGGFRFLGRFHPLVLHFPIACLTFAGLFELTRVSAKLPRLSSFVGPMLVLAAISAFITVALGIIFAANEGHSGLLIERHRNGGVTVAILTLLSAAAYFHARYNSQAAFRLGYRLGLGSAIGIMFMTAHDGGSLVHGPRFLSEHAPPVLADVLETHIPTNSALQKEAQTAQTVLSDGVRQRFQADIAPFFSRYCMRCHGSGRQEGNVRLDVLTADEITERDALTWRTIHDVLSSGRMPPKAAKQPPESKRHETEAWIEIALQEQAVANRAAQSRFPIRRLTKREIEYTLRDLFNVNAEFTSNLPADPRSEKGYDNDPDLLLVSATDLRHYQDIARQAVRQYVKVGDPTDETEYFLIELEDVYYFARGEGERLAIERASSALSQSRFDQLKSARRRAKPVYRERKYGPLPFGEIPTGDVEDVGEGRGFARLHEQFVLLKTKHDTGHVTVRIRSARSPGSTTNGSPPRLRLEAGWREGQSLKVKRIGEQDIFQDLANPQISEFNFRLEDVIDPKYATLPNGDKQRILLLALSNFARHRHGELAGSPEGQADSRLSGHADEIKAIKQQTRHAEETSSAALARMENADVPFLYLDAVEVIITPPASDSQNPWIINKPIAATDLNAELDIAKRVIEDFTAKAFRRAVKTEEVRGYIDLFKALREEGDDFEQALQETISTVLISPAYLFIGYSGNKDADGSAFNRVDHNRAIASRLSYLLWSSIPDEELRMLAETGNLQDPALLAEQVDRMLADTRSHRFTENFARQWLQLRRLNDVTVSTEYFPDFGNEFSDLIVNETIATFQDNFLNRRDARELFRSNAMMLNDQLAHHYGLDSVSGGDLRRIEMPLAQRMQHAGILTQASILTMNSNGEDSHPIKRGVWLLERILNDPPPPPPPVVPELNESAPELAGLSLKEKIEFHRRQSSCSGCHEKIDPWGIAFENYNAVGQRRSVGDHQTTQVYDARSTLPDGTEIDGAVQLAEYLLLDQEQDLMLGLTHHMMIYALGRDLDIVDEEEAEAIFIAFRSSGYKMSELIKAIIQSDAFTGRYLSERKIQNMGGNHTR